MSATYDTPTDDPSPATSVGVRWTSGAVAQFDDTAVSGLGIPGLPAGVDQIAPGLLYGIVVESQAMRLPLLAQAIESAARTGKRSVLVTPAAPDAWLHKVELAGIPLGPLVRDGRLAVMRVGEDIARRLLRIGVKRLTAELGQAVGPDPGLIVLDHADPLFVLSDPEQSSEASATLQAWARSLRHTVLATFVPDPRAPRDHALLRVLGSDFGGFAAVRSDPAGSVLELRHWFGRGGAQPRAWYRLVQERSGRIGASTIDAPAAGDEDGGDEPVVAMSAAMPSRSGELGAVRVVDSLLDAIDAARVLPAGIVVLALGDHAELPTIGKGVALIRGFGRPRVKVVVRETGQRCRLADTVALMKLGASSVIPSSADEATLSAMLRTLSGSGHHRPITAEVEEAFASCRAELSGRPLSAREFAAFSRPLLQSGRYALPNVLVRLPSGDERVPVLARRIERKRIRDVMITGFDGYAWMFVAGCTQAELPTMMRRLFGERYVQFLNASTVASDPDAILALLARFGDGVTPHAEAALAPA